jgi:SulP family sulfate permease
LTLLLLDSKRFPAALLVVGAGALIGLILGKGLAFNLLYPGDQTAWLASPT